MLKDIFVKKYHETWVTYQIYLVHKMIFGNIYILILHNLFGPVLDTKIKLLERVNVIFCSQNNINQNLFFALQNPAISFLLWFYTVKIQKSRKDVIWWHTRDSLSHVSQGSDSSQKQWVSQISRFFRS